MVRAQRTAGQLYDGRIALAPLNTLTVGMVSWPMFWAGVAVVVGLNVLLLGGAKTWQWAQV